MKLKSVFTVLAAALLLFTISNSTAKAQNNPQICLACAPSLSAITVATTPNCEWLNFTVNSGLSSRCTRLFYEWETDSPNATIQYHNGNAIIEFKQDGVWNVCVKMTIGFDRNGDGDIGLDERCTVEECTTVTIDCD